MLEGDLGDFTLPDILQLLAFTAKTGRLGVTTADARGRVELVAGHIQDASADADRLPLARRLLGRGLVDGPTLRALLEHRDRLPTDLELARELRDRDHVVAADLVEVLREQTLDAVFDLLRWTTGTFRFDAVARDATGGVGEDLLVSVEDLLAEAERRLSVWTDIRERTGPGDAVVTVGRSTEAAVEVDAHGWQLIGLADGTRTIDELALLSGRGQFDTRRALAGLLEVGVVTIGGPGAGGVEALLADQAVLSELEARYGDAPEARGSHPVEDRVPPPPPSSPPSRIPVASAYGWHVTAQPDATARELLVDVETRQEAAGVGMGVRPMRGARRSDRLRQDPSVDADLVSRLIDGVKGV